MPLRPALPHQNVALAAIAERKHAALFMDPRLGKSLVVLRWLRKHNAKLVLLVAPDLPLADWADEAKLEGWDFIRIIGTRTQRHGALTWADDPELHGECLIVAVTYSTLRFTPEVRTLNWDAVILDESTAIKNATTKTFKVVMKWLVHVPLRAVLSGLPTPQRQEEIFTQMAFVLGGKFMEHENFWKWRERFFFQIGYEYMPRKGTKDTIKAAVHAEAVMMTKADAGLKRHVERKRLLAPMDPAVAALQTKLATDWANGDQSTKIAAVASLWLEKLASGHDPAWMPLPCWKYDALLELVRDTLPGEPVVVWAKYNRELFRAAQILERGGIKCAVMTGEVDKNDRPEILKQFRLKTFRVLLLQPALARYGVDLSVADAAVYLSCGYSFEGRRQSEERTNHPTKDRPTIIYDMITENSADELVQEAILTKRSDAAWFMSVQKFLGKITVRRGKK